MRVLVIGCGYVGRRAAQAWQQQGHVISALTRSPGHAEEFRRLGWTPILGDVTSPGVLAGAPEVDVILYAVGLDRTAGHSQSTVYVDGLQNVLSACRHHAGRWLYISSTSVYGQDDGQWINEESPCQPQTPNGQVCLEAERLLRAAVPQADILRLAGIYGPGRLIARTASLQAGTPIAGRPDAWLNLIHVADVVTAILACAARGTPGETYLVCDEQPVLRRQFYERICSLQGLPAPTFAPSGDVQGLNKRCSSRKLREILKLTLQYPTIETGLPNALGLASE